jgi:hypothetical protein
MRREEKRREENLLKYAAIAWYGKAKHGGVS